MPTPRPIDPAEPREPADALPDAPRLRTRREPPRRRTVITRAAIVEAALAALDSGGVGALTMRQVAQRLGTGAASLYAHVSGKEQLLELVYDELVGRIPLPEPDPRRWEDQLRQLMRGLRDQLVAHRDAVLGGLGRIPTTPNTLAATEAVSAVLRAGGLDDRAVALGLDQLILHVSAVALEQGMYRYGGLEPHEVERYFADVHAFYRQLPPDRFPVLCEVAGEMTGHDAGERFEFGLSVLIEGLKAV